jgi:hypothetical protein
MKKLFGNVGGNQFKLLTESITLQDNNVQLRNGLRKIFESGDDELSYTRMQNMGFGFISNALNAKSIALEESKNLAKEFGYKDDINNAKFIKENSSVITEKREVEIAKQILNMSKAGIYEGIDLLAEELVKIHEKS